MQNQSSKLNMLLQDFSNQYNVVCELEEHILTLTEEKAVAYALTQALIDSAEDVALTWKKIKDCGYTGSQQQAIFQARDIKKGKVLILPTEGGGND